MVPAHEAGNSRALIDSERRQTRKLKIVATGGCGLLLASSILQVLSLVPPHLQNQMHGAAAAFAVTGLLYLIIPYKARITLEWER